MKLYVADAFTTQRFSGNQAGVAVLGTEPFPAEELMRALAGELKHSETAFVRQTGEKSFHIRYFTPAEEVDLCGHATIASFTVLRDTGAIGPGDYALHTRSRASRSFTGRRMSSRPVLTAWASRPSGRSARDRP